MPERGDFIKNCADMIPHDKRYELPYDYDRSDYLTTTKRMPNRCFQKESKRDTERGILQGGDLT